MTNKENLCVHDYSHFYTLAQRPNMCFIFDQSSGHNVFADDALVDSSMNVNPGRKQPVMHPGQLPNGQEQLMVDPKG